LLGASFIASRFRQLARAANYQAARLDGEIDQ
jgi:hypothetical protein